MGITQATAQPARCSLVNVSTGEAMECWLNPSQATEKVQVNWNRLAVPGLPHQVLQYQSTGNRQLPGVEFYLDRLIETEPRDDRDILAFRAFLLSLTVPPASTPGVAPPRTLVIWPKVMTIEAVLTEVEFHYRRFALDGSVLLYTATASFEQILDVRTTSEQLQEGR
jgi:hypothetical protein